MVSTFRHILLFLACLTIAGCEVIREDERLTVLDPVPMASNAKNHLLIEYTGINCVNCPRAAEVAHELESTYPNLIVVAMHPASNPFTKAAAKYDYTCPEADVYYQFMGGQPTTPFPAGNLNFTATDGTYFTDNNTWPTQVLAVQQDTAVVSPASSASLTGNRLSVSTSLTLCGGAERSVDVLLWVIEDNIIGAQSMPDGSVNMQYTHRHLLRTSLNGDWGETQTLRPDQPVTLRGTYTFSDSWVSGNCRVVTLILDHTTRQLLNAQSVQISND